MDNARVYRKTTKGTEAVANRDRGLQPRLRALLILVDGKRSVGELAQMTPSGFEESIEQLAQLGLVEAVEGAAAPPPVTSAPVPLAEVPAAGATVPLVQAQRFAVRRLSDMLGPLSDDICMRLERARTASEFMALVHKAEQMVDANLGSARAQEFARDMESHRPA